MYFEQGWLLGSYNSSQSNFTFTNKQSNSGITYLRISVNKCTVQIVNWGERCKSNENFENKLSIQGLDENLQK